jgi:site-specific DNA-methyltransferase (adenine-specific)
MTTTQILVGDCTESLSFLASGSAHCCVTSPPYFGLRDYGHDGQIGLEQTPDEYVAKLIEVFREVRRVLRDDGTLWLNLGDSYARTVGTDRDISSTGKVGDTLRTLEHLPNRDQKAPQGLKGKDLIGIPWRVAFALQADGWYLRQDIIWHKPNPMPESVRDRCTKAHEYIFLLSKSPKYFFDSEAIKEPASAPPKKCGPKNDATRNDGGRTGIVRGDGETRNRRDVWTISTKPFKGAHFATFPPDLIEPCVLAGSPEGGTVLDPFGGAGTTGLVANKHNRRAILCELNPTYAEMARARIGTAKIL